MDEAEQIAAPDALWLAAGALGRHGIPVFPLAGKVPMTRRGFKDAATDARAFDWRRATGIGVATGHPLPGGGCLLVVDIDQPKAGEMGGDDALGLLRALGAIRPTLGVRTGSGGLHLWYRCPPETVPTIGARIRVERLSLAVDWRGRGGYVIAPPSLHPSGTLYRPETGGEWCATKMAWIPARFLELIRKPEPVAERRPVRAVIAGGEEKARRYFEAALRGEVDNILASGPGMRNKALCKAAYKLGGYLRPWTDADALAETLMQAWRQVAPGREGEGWRAIWSGFGKGSLRPVALPGESG